MSAGIDAVVFDFDGTLADTREVVVASMRQALDVLGLPLSDPATLISGIGLPLPELLGMVGVPEALRELAAERYREVFPENARRVALFPGVAECLRELAALEIPLAIASSRGRLSLLSLLSQLAIERFFCEVLGLEDVVQKKPAPELVLTLAQRLGLPPSRMLVVGDTTFDIEMGRAAGAITCAVTYGSHDEARLRSAQPMWLVSSLADLPARMGQP